MKVFLNAALGLACAMSFSAALAQNHGQAQQGARATAQWHRPVPVENFFRDRGRYVGPYDYFRDRGRYIGPYPYFHPRYPSHPHFHYPTRPNRWHHWGPGHSTSQVRVQQQAQLTAVRTANGQAAAVAVRVDRQVIANRGSHGRR